MPTLFLSYCNEDTPIADVIEKKLSLESNNQIIISRYTRIPYKNSFVEFMNTIPEHDYIMCIVSDHYLKSQACLYEVGKILQNNNYSKKLFWVLLNENDYVYYKNSKYNLKIARIYGDETNRLSYVSYWKNEYYRLKSEIDEIDDYEATRSAQKKLHEVGCIYRNDIGEFLEYISDSKGIFLNVLIENHFKDVLNYIFPKWNMQMFDDCNDYKSFLNKAICCLHDITYTDYNQIILFMQINTHQTGLIVVADDIPKHKQRYRLVVMNGVIAEAFKNGEIINLSDINDLKYFPAVLETKSELVVPIISNGKIIGVINSESEEFNHFSKNIENDVLKLSNNISIKLQKLNYKMDNSIPYIHI